MLRVNEMTRGYEIIQADRIKIINFSNKKYIWQINL